MTWLPMTLGGRGVEVGTGVGGTGVGVGGDVARTVGVRESVGVLVGARVGVFIGVRVTVAVGVSVRASADPDTNSASASPMTAAIQPCTANYRTHVLCS